MKKTFAKVLLVIFAIVAVLSLCSCANSNVIAQPVPDEGAEISEITGKCIAYQISEDQIRVYGETNLMPGTVFMLSLDTYAGEHITDKVFSMPEDRNNFGYDFTVDAKKYGGEIYASIVCVPSENGKQPKDVQEKYGKSLQNIGGEYVIWNPAGNCAVIMSDPVFFA